MVDDREELCEKYDINYYYPTVLLFENGKVSKRLDGEPGGRAKRKPAEKNVGHPIG
jgi:hypothetical protein